MAIDIDGDGFDDGSTTAANDGSFRFDNLNLIEGTNKVSVKATNGDAETIASRNVIVDRQAPSGSLVIPISRTLYQC